MSVEIIQVSKLTVTIYPRSHKHIKSPEAAMTIHNTPDDLMGPPSLNPPSWIHGPANTHMQRDEMRAQWTVIFDLAVHRSLSALLRKKNKNWDMPFRFGQASMGSRQSTLSFLQICSSPVLLTTRTSSYWNRGTLESQKLFSFSPILQ